MATKKKTSRKQSKKTTRKYTKKTQRASPTRNTASNQIDEMTGSIGKLAITGASATMALGIGAGFANAFKSS
jgi:hypothetical protein